MPSWEIHERVCRKLIGFYDREIDKLVDSEGTHDASRYDIGVLVKHMQIIKDRFGDLGLKQLVLHHYLDRLADLCVSYKVSGFYYTPYEFDLDPKNVLNLLVYPYEYLDKILRTKFSGKDNRNRRHQAFSILYNAYKNLQNCPEVKNLIPIIKEIIKLIKENLNFVLMEISRDEKVQKRVSNAMRMKALAPKIREVWMNIRHEYKQNLLRTTVTKTNMETNKTENTENKAKKDTKNVLIDRILKLDEKYMDAHDLKSRASILSQMIQLACELCPSIRDENVKNEFGREQKLYETAYLYIRYAMEQNGYYSHEYGRYLSWLDFIRARILSKLAEENLL